MVVLSYKGNRNFLAISGKLHGNCWTFRYTTSFITRSFWKFPVIDIAWNFKIQLSTIKGFFTLLFRIHSAILKNILKSCNADDTYKNVKQFLPVPQRKSFLIQKWYLCNITKFHISLMFLNMTVPSIIDH